MAKAFFCYTCFLRVVPSRCTNSVIYSKLWDTLKHSIISHRHSLASYIFVEITVPDLPKNISQRNVIVIMLFLALCTLSSVGVNSIQSRIFGNGEELELKDRVVQKIRVTQKELKSQKDTIDPIPFPFLKRDFVLGSKKSVLPFEVVTNKLVQPESQVFPAFFRKDNQTDNILYCDKAHGLFSNAILTQIEDDRGYFWLGSEDEGLCKTNGSKSWVYTKESGLKSNTINQLYQDAEGRLWIAWDFGISYVLNGSIYHLSNSKLNTTTIQRIREDKHGALWFCSSSKGLFKFHENRLEVLDAKRGFPGTNVKDIEFGSKGELFVACMNDGLILLNGLNGSQISESEKSANNFAPASILKDKGRIWIGSYLGSNFFYENGKLYQFKLRNGYERCFKILKNKLGVWYADYSFGVILIRKDGKIKRYGAKNGLTDRNAIDIVFDHNSNVWVADPFSGISMIRVTPFYMKDWPIPYPTQIYSKDQDNFWISSNGTGLNEIKKSELLSYNAIPDKRNLTLDHSWDLVVGKDGTVWSSSHGLGVAQMKGGKMIYHQFKSGNVIHDLTSDELGGIWFSTLDEGLRKWDSKTEKFTLFSKKDGLSSNVIRSTTLDKTGKLWVCTDKGIDVLFKNTIQHLGKETGLCSDNVNRVYQDESGDYWVASNDNGISYISNGKIQNVSRKDGLISNKIVSLTGGESNEIWLNTKSGLSRIRKDKSSLSVQNFGVDYGSFMLDFTTASVHTGNGAMLFGTSKGILEYDPYFEEPEEGSPRLNLEDYSINGEVQIVGDKSLIDLSRSDELLMGISLIYWGKMEGVKLYYCFTKGDDKGAKHWRAVDYNQRFPIDTRVERGDYQIEFKVQSGKKSYEFKGIQVRVRIPWYDTWWFFVVLISAFISLFVLVLRLRLEMLKKRKKELERIVESRTRELNSEKQELARAKISIEQKIKEKDALIYEMHHRVKNNLQMISTLLDMQLRTLKDEAGILVLKEAVRRIAAMSASHELLYSTQDDFTDIDLSLFIQNLIHSQRSIMCDEKQNLEILFETDSVMVNVSTAISVGMIISECISNAVKHAFPNVDLPTIKIGLKNESIGVVLTISDNGKGGIQQEENSRKEGLGLRLIRIFSKKINGEIDVKSNTNGTEIRIVFKM